MEQQEIPVPLFLQNDVRESDRKQALQAIADKRETKVMNCGV